MGTAKQNRCTPGVGFLFTPHGLSMKDLATKLHEEGYLTDEEMAPCRFTRIHTPSPA